MSVNVYSGFPQLAYNFSKNFSARMHRSSLGYVACRVQCRAVVNYVVGHVTRDVWSDKPRSRRPTGVSPPSPAAAAAMVNDHRFTGASAPESTGNNSCACLHKVGYEFMTFHMLRFNGWQTIIITVL